MRQTGIKTIGRNFEPGFSYQKSFLNINTDLSQKYTYSIVLFLSYYLSKQPDTESTRLQITQNQTILYRLTLVNSRNQVLYSKLPLTSLVSDASGDPFVSEGSISPFEFTLPPICGIIDYSKSYLESQNQAKLPAIYVPFTVFYYV